MYVVNNCIRMYIYIYIYVRVCVCISCYTCAVMHLGIAIPGWRGKRSRYFRRMRNPHYYVSVIADGCPTTAVRITGHDRKQTLNKIQST